MIAAVPMGAVTCFLHESPTLPNRFQPILKGQRIRSGQGREFTQ